MISALFVLMAAVPGSAEATPVQASPMATWSAEGARVAQAEAIKRFDLKQRLISYGSQYFRPDDNATIRVIEGDLAIAGSLRLDWDNCTSHGLIVTGDLSVDGAIVNAGMNGGPFLLVGGKTRAYAVIGGGAELVFEGDTQVEEIVVGHYNDGILMFRKNLAAPAVVTMDHHLEIRGDLDGRWFDVFDGDDVWSTFLDTDQPALAVMQEDDWEGLRTALIPALEARGSVLRPNLPGKSEHPKYGR